MKIITIIDNTLFMLDENNTIIYNTQLSHDTDVNELVSKLTASFSDVEILTQDKFYEYPEVMQKCIKYNSANEATIYCTDILDKELSSIPSLTVRELKYIKSTVLSVLSTVSPPETVPTSNNGTDITEFYSLLSNCIANAVVNKIKKEVEISGRFSI